MTTEDDERVAAEIGRLRGSRTVATAESITAGMVAQRLAAATGSMEWFRGGVVAYQRLVKQHVLGVDPGPVVSDPTAREMAIGASKLFDSDIAVSVTGAAGPDPLDGADPGTVYVGVSIAGDTAAFPHRFSGSPAEICAQACTAALHDLASCLRREARPAGDSVT